MFSCTLGFGFLELGGDGSKGSLHRGVLVVPVAVPSGALALGEFQEERHLVLNQIGLLHTAVNVNDEVREGHDHSRVVGVNDKDWVLCDNPGHHEAPSFLEDIEEGSLVTADYGSVGPVARAILSQHRA